MKALRFEGRGGEYFRIWIVNVLLTIVTLSVYYPWAKVRTRRYFLASTTLEGRGFDYHATGRQLLPGYLISVVLVLLFVGAQAVFPLAGPVLGLVLLLAGPWIVWRSVSFNMRMTSFSNVRFGFDGTAGGAYASYLLWPLLLVAAVLSGPAIGFATQGLETDGNVLVLAIVAIVLSFAGYAAVFFAYAAMKSRQTHYLVDGYRYGQGRFATAVRAGGFARILIKTIGLSLGVLLAVLTLTAVVAFATGAATDLLSLMGKLDDPEALESVFSGGAAFVLIPLVYVGLLFAGMLLLAYAYTRQRAYILGRSTLDGTVRFASTLGARRYAWVLTSNLVLIAVTLGLGTPWARTRLARTVVERTEVDVGAGLDGYVDAKRAEQSSLGEQIGDAFDVDVGIGF